MHHAPCRWRRAAGQGASVPHPRDAHAFSIQILHFSFIMAKIDKFIIERILDAARIEEVVGDFPDVDLKKKGVRYLGLCPFHDDRHRGSFVVLPRRIRNNKVEGNCFKCFSCGAKGGVVDFVMKHEKLSYPDAIRWLGKKYSIETDMQDFNYTPPPPRPAPPPLQPLRLPMGMVERTEKTDGDLLVQWIKTGINWDYIQRKRIDEVLKDYHVGHGKNGHTIFWQLDDRGEVRTGKMMKYRPDGHRDKTSPWNFDWIHSALFRDKRLTKWNEDKQEAQLTFFGMHLLNRYPHATVNIVESEKTAVLMAISYGNHATQVWMACGGLEMLSAERLKPITSQGRQIVLFPDRDGVAKWRAKAAQLPYKSIMLNEQPVTEWWKPQDGDKADVADVVVRILNERKPMTNIDDVKATMPQAAPLIDKLNLTITQQHEQPTETS